MYLHTYICTQKTKHHTNNNQTNNYENVRLLIKKYIEIIHRKKYISDKVYNYIKPSCLPINLAPSIYYQKITKQLYRRDTNCIINKLNHSKYIGIFRQYCLQPKLKSYFKDTNDFSKKN